MLTNRQLQVLGFLMDGHRRGIPPTKRQLARFVGSFGDYTNAADCHLRALVKKGLVRLGKGARAIELTCQFLIAYEEVARINEEKVTFAKKR